MIEIPTDPIDLWINRAHKLALTLMDEPVIINYGNMNTPNKIVHTNFDFEYLDSEVAIAARQLSRLIRRTQMQLAPYLLSRKIRQMGRSKAGSA